MEGINKRILENKGESTIHCVTDGNLMSVDSELPIYCCEEYNRWIDIVTVNVKEAAGIVSVDEEHH